jgi:hypothetical protein
MSVSPNYIKGVYLGTLGAFGSGTTEITGYDDTITHIKKVLGSTDSQWGGKGVRITKWIVNGKEFTPNPSEFHTLADFEAALAVIKMCCYRL